MRAFFIGHEIFRRSSYGAKHPLAIPRVSTLIDLCRSLDWLNDDNYLTSPTASPDELARFHARDYIAAVQQAEGSQSLDEDSSRRYGLGRNGNPIFREVYSRPATACGGSILAARLLSDRKAGIKVVYNPAGGTHHGRRAEASGFCYFNDPVLAILALLDKGFRRIFYLDVDAHHGDGVQLALMGEKRVRVLSIHEEGRWPMVAGGLGSAVDRGSGNAFNIPVPKGFNDREMDYLREAVIIPLLQDYDPEVVVCQGGADALSEDPLSRLSLSNGALWRILYSLRDLAPKLLLLGGGGYNPWSVARCWAGFWAIVSAKEIPARLPGPAESLLRSLSWRHSLGRNPPDAWFTTIGDEARPGPLRDEVRLAAACALKPIGDQDVA